MANRTVKDFEFPASFGFTGSGGKTPVKGYMRGGSVAPKKGPEARIKSSPPDIGWTDYKKGGPVKKALGGPVNPAQALAARRSQKASDLLTRSSTPRPPPGTVTAVNGRALQRQGPMAGVPSNHGGPLPPNSAMAKGGKVHDDKAEDVKLIRSEISKAEKSEDESTEMKRGGKAKKGKSSRRKAPPMPRAVGALSRRGVPAYNPEPLIAQAPMPTEMPMMKKGGKSKC